MSFLARTRRPAPHRFRMSMPALSVVMPAYNEEASIDRAIDEVVREVFAVVPDAELVVVDDGSRDATASACRAWAARDARIRLVRKPTAVTAPR